MGNKTALIMKTGISTLFLLIKKKVKKKFCEGIFFLFYSIISISLSVVFMGASSLHKLHCFPILEKQLSHMLEFFFFFVLEFDVFCFGCLMNLYRF